RRRPPGPRRGGVAETGGSGRAAVAPLGDAPAEEMPVLPLPVRAGREGGEAAAGVPEAAGSGRAAAGDAAGLPAKAPRGEHGAPAPRGARQGQSGRDGG